MVAGLKLGPEGFKNIAIVGTAQSSMELAPFKDPSWAIWACSPGSYGVCAKNRSDVFFETHRWLPTSPGQYGAPGTKPWFSAEYHAFLKAHKGPVFMSETDPSIASSVRVPFEFLTKKYGPYQWTSTVAYMLALAIEVLGPRAAEGEQVTLGLWGIDMAATEEYAYQRPACQHFIGMAKALGINIMLPRETDLMRPPSRYGIAEYNPRHIRMSARLAECDAAIAQLSQQAEMIKQQLISRTAAKAEIQYWMETWAEDVVVDIQDAITLASYAGRERGVLLEKESTGAEVLPLTEAKNA